METRNHQKNGANRKARRVGYVKYVVMKTKILIIIISILVLNAKIDAQCEHNPTILPNDLIMCPNSIDTLWTQVYDSYQWYKDGNLIPGATNQYYVVSTYQDAGSSFSVNATLNSCTEMSPDVLVDGWAFLPVTVTTIGYSDTLCIGDTLWLIINLPYTTNIKWYKNNVPIPGANNDTLIVITSGSYNVFGAPPQCPTYIQQLGIPMIYNFLNCTTGMDEKKLQSSITVYPNPTTGKFIVTSSNKINSIEIYNILGVQIYPLQSIKKQMSNEIDLSGFPKGMYFVKINDGKKVYISKIEIQ